MASLKKTNKTWEDLESIRQKLFEEIFPSIQDTRNEIERYKIELLIDKEGVPSVKTRINELETKITELKTQADQYVAQIIELHKSIFGSDTQTQDTLKEKIEALLSSIEDLFNETAEKKGEFDSLYKKVFGEKDESGQIREGLQGELEKYTDKYKALFTNIETLLPGATSAGLSEVFASKVSEYETSENNWSRLFLSSVIILAIYFGYDVITSTPSIDFTAALLKILHKGPFLIFTIWLVVFIGNRRAESKKLEEAYKHKEVMSRSYVGYKQSIEDLAEDDKDKTLLRAHMQNLLDAIKENSGDFLNNQGDKHPLLGILSTWLGDHKEKDES